MIQSTLPLSDLESMKHADLKTLVCQRGIGDAGWRQTARKAELVEALSTGVAPTSSGAARIDLAAAIAEGIASYLPAPDASLDEDRIREIIREESPVTRVEVQTARGATVDVGVQHKAFPTLLAAVQVGPVMLVGPAGSGKTHAASAVADALELPFYCQSVCAQTSVYRLEGYQDANGQYVRSPLRDAYENGGVYLLDEVDNGNANALAVLNAALSNGHYSFPDRQVPRHSDFHCIAGANTYGHGADRQYVGRNALDGAFLDRFAVLTWDYDATLERTLAGDDAWTETVQALRARAEELRLQVIISPRASIQGAKLLEAGMPRDTVLDLTVRKGLDGATWDKLSEGIL